MTYNFKLDSKGDLFGGLNAAIVALPLVMAFGVESGLGAAAGIIGAVVLSTITSIIGATPLLISGPTAAVTVASSLIIANELEHAATPDEALTTLFVIFLLAGAIQCILGSLRVGSYIRYVPYPVISGFMNGIGVIMILIQIMPLLGHPTDIHINSLIQNIPKALQQTNYYAFLLGLATITLVYVGRRFLRVVPSTLIAVMVVSTFSWLMNWNVPTIGDVSHEWISWRWHHLLKFDQVQWSVVFLPALTIALLGSIDTLLTSLVIDMVTGKTHHSDLELIGQGAGNMLTAFAGGLPGSGAVLRSVTSINAGARTKVASFVQGGVLLVVLTEAINVLKQIPFAVLAGILVTVGFSVLDKKGLRDFWKIPFTDALLMTVVMSVTVFFGLLPAFVVGLVLASFTFVKKVAEENKATSSPLALMTVDDPDTDATDKVYQSREIIVHELTGPLFFGFAAHFKEALQALPGARAVIFRMELVPFIDQSGLYALQDVLRALGKRKIALYFTGLQKGPREQLMKMGIIPDLINPDNLYNSFSHAADKVEQFLKVNLAAKLRQTNRDELKLDHLKDRMN